MPENQDKLGKQNISVGITVIPVVLTVIIESFIYSGKYTAQQEVLWIVLNIISAVAIPLFFISLGYSFSFVKARVRYILNLIYIYIVLSLIHLLAYRAAPKYFYQDTKAGIWDIFIKGTGTLWIIYVCIFYCILFTIYKLITKRAGTRLLTAFIILAVLIALAFFSDLRIAETKFSLFSLHKAARYAVFFFFGAFFGLHGETVNEFVKKKRAVILLSLLAAAGIAVAVIYWKKYGYQCLYRIPAAGLCIALLCSIPLWFLIHNAKWKIPLLGYIGINALYVYAAAEPVSVFVRAAENKTGIYLPYIDVILAVVLTFAAVLVIVFILEKIKIRRPLLEPFSYANTVKGTIVVLLRALCVIILLASVVFLASSIWLVSTWGEVAFDELLFHITQPLEGANAGMVKDYVIRYGILEIVIIIIVTAATCVLYKKLSSKMRKWVAIAEIIAAVIIFGIGIGVLDSKLGVIGYVKAQMTDEDFIYDNYAAPDDANITFPEKKRNLIYIYLESVEVTYTDTQSGGAFSYNCIPELTALADEGDCFSGDSSILNGAIPCRGATYTVGAMFAHSSGLPLKVSVAGNDMDTQSAFFPNIKCIGDILEDEGYTNELMIGSEAAFGGRKALYSTHGDHKLFDYNYARENGYIPEDYNVWWGFEDEKLFDFAKEELERLSREEAPFNLTLLTVDTHFEDGYVCHLCRDEFGDQYANVMACSSRQVCAFVDWIRQQDFYEDTLVVLVGDHNTMDTDFCAGVPKGYQRKVYTLFLNSAKNPENDSYRTYSTMDLFPTTLSAMGVEFDGNRLGLGVDLYSDGETLLEQYDYDTLDLYLNQRSAFMSSQGGTGYTEEWVVKQNTDNTFEVTLAEHDVIRGKYIFDITLRDLSRLDNRENYKGLYADIYANGKLIGCEAFEYAGNINNKKVYQCRAEIDEYSMLTDGDAAIRVRLEDKESLILYEVSSPEKAFVFTDPAMYTAALDNEDYLVFIAAKDEAVEMMDDELKENLERLGCGIDFDEAYRKGFCFIKDPVSQNVIESVSASEADEVSVAGSIEGVDYELISAGYDSTNRAVIMLNGTEQSLNKRGLNMVVYDLKLGRVISSVTIDTHKSLIISHKNCNPILD